MPPENVQFIPTTSTSISVLWEPPNLPLLTHTLSGYTVSCNNSHTLDVSPDLHAVTMTSLLPFTEYSCCVTARTTTGLLGETCGNITTLEDGEHFCIKKQSSIGFMYVNWHSSRSAVATPYIGIDQV